MKRVVITGMGIVSPLGHGLEANWEEGLLKKKSGISKITKCECEDLAAKVAGQVPLGEAKGEFNADAYVDVKDRKKMDDFIVYGIAAGVDAVEDSGIMNGLTDEEKDEVGVSIGSGIGGLESIWQASTILNEKGPRRISPFFIPSALINLASGHLSIKYGLRGPNTAPVTACATGTHAIGDAFEMIRRGDALAMVAGGAEAAVTRLGIAGFASARALSTGYNDTPEVASRPWDKERDGFVMGEGAGVLVLEEYEHAKARGAKIYGEVVGYGMSGDAYHMTLPAPEGNGGFRAMKQALRKAEIKPSDVDYINAHGTSTPGGDMLEFTAVKNMFEGTDVSMSSTKSSVGHLLGAAGAVEAVYSLLAMRDSIIPATLNCNDPEEGTEVIDIVRGDNKQKDIKYALSNSFGFGGTNASLIFKKFED
ncbi:MAG: beta-ketoacyl-ACP synthase II [Alphaproteobacteria bacterium]|jgi:3-oxoacyl-[acyl-carrier-protein] synthase II|nr:beta-ketoacyl-ACP synthase II [Alphaproteobacteria bacterium]